jgi:AcrR family transcriptional regulator
VASKASKASRPERPRAGNKASRPERPRAGNKASRPERPRAGNTASRPERPRAGNTASRPERVLATDGRVIGSRASATRARLLEATATLLAEQGVLELKVVDITRAVRTSPATFYQYFGDVNDAILALADDAAAEMAPLVALLGEAWTDDEALERARAFTNAFFDYWVGHQAVLRARNLQAEEGDQRFRDSRVKAYQGLMAPLLAKIEDGQAEGRLSPTLNPYATAAAMVAVLERLVAFQAEFARRGVTRSAMVDTIAVILVQTLTGHAPD